jgi:AcrR family transcriptional regulator
MKKRKYTLKQRATQQQQTRERIVDAAMALHEELGPAETTISAVAERAGVQRLTVYRHFPSEREMFGACSSKWLGLNPPPDTSKIQSAGPAERTRAVLLALYRYYQDTEKMWASVYRDLEKVPALSEPMAGFEGYLSAIRKELLADWAPCKSRQLRATLGHALRFSTWQSLAGQGLGRAAMADLVCAWVRAAAGGQLTAVGRSETTTP